MTLRALPELHAANAPRDTTFELAPKALAAWNPNVVAAAGDAGDVISILDVIGENYEGTGVTARRVAEALRAIGSRPVTVQINSPGGNYFEGLAIYNFLRAHGAEVTVQVLGIAASAASVIAMAGDTIQIAKAGLMMIHNTQWVAIGDRHTMLETHNTMKVFDDALVGLYADRTGNVRDVVAKMMDDTTFMSGETAVENGFADELLAADKIATVTNAIDERPVAYKIEAVMARHGVPRTERRALLKELTGGTPSAVSNAKPSAGEAAANHGHVSLAVALSHLRRT